MLASAKALDIFGRPQGFLFCVVTAVVGLILSATCNNVEAYAASQVLYLVGINCLGFSLNVFLADIISLRHRGLVVALCSTGYVITPWLGGPISSAFLKGAGWRWAFGMNSILIPAVTIELSDLVTNHLSKATKKGIVPTRPSGRTLWGSLVYYLREFDVVGLFLLCAGVAFFLLPSIFIRCKLRDGALP
jgi:MFS family permease